MYVGSEITVVAGILLAKLLEGHSASFVRLEGDSFMVSVNGQERSISRAIWRSLPELEGQGSSSSSAQPTLKWERRLLLLFGEAR